MLAIIEKVKNLFKCKCEKEESAPQQEEPKAEEIVEEQAGSSEQSN